MWGEERKNKHLECAMQGERATVTRNTRTHEKTRNGDSTFLSFTILIGAPFALLLTIVQLCECQWSNFIRFRALCDSVTQSSSCIFCHFAVEGVRMSLEHGEREQKEKRGKKVPLSHFSFSCPLWSVSFLSLQRQRKQGREESQMTYGFRSGQLLRLIDAWYVATHTKYWVAFLSFKLSYSTERKIRQTLADVERTEKKMKKKSQSIRWK